jgi:diaminohydroxyphosphoribosylaminopyrimidine deaminase/5-amino-6-(5-phosphoribosylamino)uracil reductase
MSLDGKIATRNGDSKWISSQESRHHAHYLRHVTDAIMVGVNTILADDPQLTARCHERGGMARKQPLRVIVDSRGRTPVTASVFQQPGETLLAFGEEIGEQRQQEYISAGAGVVVVGTKDGRLDIKQLLGILGQRDITSVLIEGGGAILGSLFDRRLVDKVIAFIAPVIIGGDNAITAVGGEGVSRIADALRLERVTTMTCDGDIIVTGYVGG